MIYALWHRRAGFQEVSLRLLSTIAPPRQSSRYLRRPFDFSWACIAWQSWNLKAPWTLAERRDIAWRAPRPSGRVFSNREVF